MNTDPDSDPHSKYNDDVPEDVLEEAKNISLDLLPKISRKNYDAAYQAFKQWKLTKKTSSSSEEMLMVYFKDQLEKKKYKPTTLWSRHSMLKATLKTYENIDISKYLKLTAFMKKQTTGFRSKKSKVFTAKEIETFLNEAPDNEYLVIKVACILGTTGGLRNHELTDLTVDKFVSLTSSQGKRLLQIHIPDTKTKQPKSFVITDGFMNIVERYRALRPKNASSNRFFLNYRNSKCYIQNIGINKIRNMPKQVAQYLKLPDAHEYTGHSWRRTSATLLADSGADITTLKRHGGWKSDRVAESYVENSLYIKQKINEKITESVNLIPSTSVESYDHPPTAKVPKKDNGMDFEPQASTSKEANFAANKENFQPLASTSEDLACSVMNDEIITLPASTNAVTNVFHLHNCSNLTFMTGQK